MRPAWPVADGTAAPVAAAHETRAAGRAPLPVAAGQVGKVMDVLAMHCGRTFPMPTPRSPHRPHERRTAVLAPI